MVTFATVLHGRTRWLLVAAVALVALVVGVWSVVRAGHGTSAATSHATVTVPPGTVLAINPWEVSSVDPPLVALDPERGLYRVAGVRDAVSVAADAYSENGWALLEDGGVMSWGPDNGLGRLGDGTTNVRTTPVVPVNLTDVTAVATNYYATYVLTRDGVVWAWGEDGASFGLRPGAGNRTLPEPVVGVSDVTAVAAVDMAAWALTSDGTVWGWGYWCSTTNDFAPEAVPGMVGVVDIAGASNGMAAVLEDGTVWWVGPPPGGSAPCDTLIPTQVPGLSGIVDIDGYDSLANWDDGLTAITATGDLWRADRPRGETDRWDVKKIPSLRDVVQAPAATEYALCADGTVWQYTDGATQVTGLPPVRSISGNAAQLFLVTGPR